MRNDIDYKLRKLAEAILYVAKESATMSGYHQEDDSVSQGISLDKDLWIALDKIIYDGRDFDEKA